MFYGPWKNSLSKVPVCRTFFFFGWLKQPSSHILSPRRKLAQQRRLLCWHQIQKHPLPLRMGHMMAPQCFLLPPWSSLDSALLREFMGSDKRCRENTRQLVCKAAVCDSFPHFIHMLWLIRFFGRQDTRVWFSVHRNMLLMWCIKVAGVKLTMSLWRTITFVFVQRSPPGM